MLAVVLLWAHAHKKTQEVCAYEKFALIKKMRLTTWAYGKFGTCYIQSTKNYLEYNTLREIICLHRLSLTALQPSFQLIHVYMNLIKRNLSLSFRGQDIPCFDAGSHRAKLICVHLQEPMSQPLTFKQWWEKWNVLDFYFQHIAPLVLLMMTFKNALQHHCNTTKHTQTWCYC